MKIKTREVSYSEVIKLKPKKHKKPLKPLFIEHRGRFYVLTK